MARPPMISRRTILRGAGAAVALPWLDAMAPRTAMAAGGAAAAAAKPPVRMAFFYVPNGVHMPNWKPKHTGVSYELPRILKSLEPVRDKITVLSDLAADHCIGKGAGHEPSGGGFLVGEKCKLSEIPEVGGVSVDQLAAKQVGNDTPIDSLALGIDPGHRGDHGYSGTYLSHISWRSKTTPVDLELNPKQLFDRLFRGRKPQRPDWTAESGDAATKKVDTIETSVLDLVREDARDLRGELGTGDRRKLEEYLDGVRDIERRIERAERDKHSHHREGLAEEAERGRYSDLPELIMPDGHGIPSEYAEHVNLMLDVLTLAFQTDTTRIASFMFSYEKSGRAYPEIEAPGSHHSTSHHRGKPENHEALTRINTHHMELFARMLQRMANTWEGESTLLDNVAICYGSGISDGNKHNHDDLPVLLAGGGGGTIKGGRHIALIKKTPICNLYLEMLDRVGLRLDSFGDSSGRLPQLA
ncbi:MAG: DUF1552 domain-containing protein [Phycisphaera sp.]|nr:DUF1552 domain-containing protein [Phycisphaera sp.]